jgi:hypothetical protein
LKWEREGRGYPLLRRMQRVVGPLPVNGSERETERRVLD